MNKENFGENHKKNQRKKNMQRNTVAIYSVSRRNQQF